MRSGSRPYSSAPGGTHPRSVRWLAIVSATMIFSLIVVGSAVRASELRIPCPDWSACFGGLLFPTAPASFDLLHLILASVSIGAVLALIGLIRKKYQQAHWLNLLVETASVTLLLPMLVRVALLWRHDILRMSPWLNGVDFVLLLLAFTLALWVVVIVMPRRGTFLDRPRLVFRSPFARLSLAAYILMFLVLFSGVFLSGSDAAKACQSWPLCLEGRQLAGSGMWINQVHRLIVAVSAVLMAALFWGAWRSQRTYTPVIVSATVAFVLFVSQALLGARLVQGFPFYLLALHQATSVAVWAALSVLVFYVGHAARSIEKEQTEAFAVRPRRAVIRDLWMLTKPVVVALLLVTTYAGMVIGAKHWPSSSLAFWTLLGGFMAAGGSGAINQYIDRDDDSKMQRTQKRPIPSGRLTPGEGLAFGVGMALASFYVMVAFVNFLSAVLTLAGILYYVMVYSIFLKKATPQNIVIGGGAGAIPPLVGWAAATGSLNLPAWLLFILVFMWTPPHFWALALVRQRDYARAGVPMLPVVRGERETRWQIFLYTLELVLLTLFFPLFGLGGSIYLVAAVILGGWLLMAAWKVWKRGGNRVAWKMYRYSSMYLAFIFVVLMLDAVFKL